MKNLRSESDFPTLLKYKFYVLEQYFPEAFRKGHFDVQDQKEDDSNFNLSNLPESSIRPVNQSVISSFSCNEILKEFEDRGILAVVEQGSNEMLSSGSIKPNSESPPARSQEPSRLSIKATHSDKIPKSLLIDSEDEDNESDSGQREQQQEQAYDKHISEPNEEQIDPLDTPVIIEREDQIFSQKRESRQKIPSLPSISGAMGRNQPNNTSILQDIEQSEGGPVKTREIDSPMDEKQNLGGQNIMGSSKDRQQLQRLTEEKQENRLTKSEALNDEGNSESYLFEVKKQESQKVVGRQQRRGDFDFEDHEDDRLNMGNQKQPTHQLMQANFRDRGQVAFNIGGGLMEESLVEQFKREYNQTTGQEWLQAPCQCAHKGSLDEEQVRRIFHEEFLKMSGQIRAQNDAKYEQLASQIGELDHSLRELRREVEADRKEKNAKDQQRDERILGLSNQIPRLMENLLNGSFFKDK